MYTTRRVEHSRVAEWRGYDHGTARHKFDHYEPRSGWMGSGFSQRTKRLGIRTVFMHLRRADGARDSAATYCNSSAANRNPSTADWNYPASCGNACAPYWSFAASMPVSAPSYPCTPYWHCPTNLSASHARATDWDCSTVTASKLRQDANHGMYGDRPDARQQFEHA